MTILIKMWRPPFSLLNVFFAWPLIVLAHSVPAGSAIDTEVHQIMALTRANGMAVAVVDHGTVAFVQSYGIRNANRDSLTTDTVTYGASLTKTVFAYTVMQLVDQAQARYSGRGGPRHAAAHLCS